MTSQILLALFVLTSFWVVKKFLHFRAVLASVKATGLPYIVVLLHSRNNLAGLTQGLWRPLLSKLPESWKGHWFMMTEIELYWVNGYNLFRKIGSDTFLTVSLNGDPEMFTCDPSVISQIVGRRQDFPKPLRQYAVLNIYGRNVVTTEGQDWRRHRKVVGPPFTEKNNHLVWDESVYQARAMLDHLLHKDLSGTPSIDDLGSHLSYIALGVISKAGYGVRLGWKDETGETKYFSKEHEKAASNPLLGDEWVDGKTGGHQKSFGDTMLLLARDILLILIIPEFLLEHLPFERTRSAGHTYKDWGGYMKDMLLAKRKELESDESKSTSQDLLTTLVRDLEKSTKGTTRTGDGSKNDKEVARLTDEEILGNSFMLMIAGHETSAGVLHHAVMMMAVDPSVQRRLQAELDNIFQGKSPDEWSFEKYFPKVFDGMAGAIMAEALRLIPPVLEIPKWCPTPQPIDLNGRTYTVPADTEVSLLLSGAHRNPKHWPHGKPNPDLIQYSGWDARETETDLAEFKPQRWLDHDAPPAAATTTNTTTTTADRASKSSNVETEALSISLGADNGASLLKPVRGAYLPFSEGFRSCMGRRFAQVEFMAVLAVVFQQYSVELAVDAWASDAEVVDMTPTERKAVWLKARDSVSDGFTNDMANVITIRMRSRKVPMRFVKRGSERFDFAAAS